MARKLRIHYAGALYHVINRGNCRRDQCESVGAPESILTALAEEGHSSSESTNSDLTQSARRR